jgi:predicted aspartyl protease
MDLILLVVTVLSPVMAYALLPELPVVEQPAVATPAALFAENRFAASRDAYRHALIAAPRDVALRNGLVRTLLRLDDWHAALAQGKKAVETAPDCAAAHGLYALTLLRAGQPAAADGEAAAALRRDPDDYWGLIAQGRLQLWEQDHKGAGVTLRRAAALKPREPDAWFYLIGACTGEQTKEQRQLMDTYLALRPHGHPHDTGVEELAGMRKMLDSFGDETPFRAATPELEAALQAADAGKTPPVSFTMPIQSRDHAVLVTMVVQGRKLDLLFDTGGGSGVLLARSTAQQLHLPSLGTVTVRGASGKEPARQYKAETLALGDLNLRGVPIHAVEGELGPFDGVFGVRSLDPYVVTIDFAESALTLMRGKAAQAPPPLHGSRVVQLPFHDLGGNMIVPVTIEGHPTWAMIDTGASMDLLMSLELARSVAAKRAQDSWREGAMPGRGGVGTTVTTRSILMFRDPISLRIGNGAADASAIPVTMAAGTDAVDCQLGPAYEFQVGGIIGIGLLMQAKRVTFDYPHHMLTLEYPSGT